MWLRAHNGRRSSGREARWRELAGAGAVQQCSADSVLKRKPARSGRGNAGRSQSLCRLWGGRRVRGRQTGSSGAGLDCVCRDGGVGWGSSNQSANIGHWPELAADALKIETACALRGRRTLPRRRITAASHLALTSYKNCCQSVHGAHKSGSAGACARL